jgi:hypothetical protein
VTCDIDQISVLASTPVTHDCRIDQNCTVVYTFRGLLRLMAPKSTEFEDCNGYLGCLDKFVKIFDPVLKSRQILSGQEWLMTQLGSAGIIRGPGVS